MPGKGAKSTEDADMADSDGEKVVTMMDVLQEQEEFEEDANAVLGASDDKNCTYSKGYVKRQAIYACLTCCSEAKTDRTKRAGVCLACSLNCHENHELVELYTKRNFRCDCGNPKFNSHPCQFTPNKTDLNYDNHYNQNFSGVYCTCHRPYPDPESTEDDEMIQCVVCEDWHHTTHLEATVPFNDQYAEMVCKDCMEDNDFLHDYSHLVINTVDKVVTVSDPDLDVTMPPVQYKGSQQAFTNGKVEAKTDEPIEKLVVESQTNSESANKEDFENENKIVHENDDSIAGNEQKQVDVQNDENKVDKNDANEMSLTEEEKDEKSAPKVEEDTQATGDINPEEAITEPKSDEKEPSIEVNISENKLEPTVSAENSATEPIDGNQVADDSIPKAENTDDNTEQAKPDITDPQILEKMEEDRLLQDDTETQKPNEENTESTTTCDTKNEANAEPPTEKEDNTTQETSENKTEGESGKELPDKPSEVSNDEEMKDDSISKNELVQEEDQVPKESGSQENKRKLSTEEESNTDILTTKKPKLNDCVRPRGVKKVYHGATFWPSNFRLKLCTCSECISMYKDLAVLFLIDQDDTVTAYEALGKEKNDGSPSSQYEKGLQALSSLDRVQQINALTEYNKMRDKLLDFLKSFKDRKEIVKEDDIKAFFAGMKPKREPDGVYFCR